MGAGELHQQLRALATLPEDPGLKPTWCIATICNSSPRESGVLFWPPGVLHMCGDRQTYMQTNTHTHAKTTTRKENKQPKYIPACKHLKNKTNNNPKTW